MSRFTERCILVALLVILVLALTMAPKHANAQVSEFARKPIQIMSVDDDGNIVFSQGATIDFAGYAPPELEPDLAPRWVLVYVNGEPNLIPVFRAITQRPKKPIAPQ